MSYNAPINTANAQAGFDPRAFAILQLQRIGYRVGLIKITDFLRRDENEELAHKTKNDRELQDWLDALRFKDFNAKLAEFIDEQKDTVDQNIDSINQAINRLKARPFDKEQEAVIEDLKTLKSEFQNYKTRLRDIDKERKAARTIEDIKTVATAAENTAADIMHARLHSPSVQRGSMYLWDSAPGAKPTDPRGKKAKEPDYDWDLDLNSDPADSKETKEEAEKRYKLILKGHLKSLSHETDNRIIEDRFKLLRSVFGKPRVVDVLTELKRDTGEAKFDIMLAVFQRITAPKPGGPAP